MCLCVCVGGCANVCWCVYVMLHVLRCAMAAATVIHIHKIGSRQHGSCYRDPYSQNKQQTMVLAKHNVYILLIS